MLSEQRRYFIELQPDDGIPPPRNRATEQRREQAAHFIADLGAWLQREALEGKVASMAVTALGQVQITCEADIINQICHQDEERIAAVRPGAMFVENMGRWNEAR